ncbi:hypothetical protein [Clostridioides difficile]|uniref:hypothetical protein n=1 Tax=Clostridioides difficile TaxID=1496 RepID=UPI0021CF0416|nr:hypothetical protein [Clostridioides difficile]
MNYRLKKSVTTILSLLIMTILLPTNVSASKVEDSSMKVIYSEKQVTDMDKLYNMAKNGITDVKSSNEKGIIKNARTGEFIYVDSISTTQLLEVKQPKNLTSKTYSKTVFFDTNTIKPLRKASISEDGWDKTGGVKASGTVTYTISKGDGAFQYISVSKVYGNWSIADGQIRVTNRRVHINQTGFISNGLGIKQQQKKEPTSNSFSYNAPSSWKPVGRDSVQYNCGFESIATLVRGGSSWAFNFIVQT